MTKIREAVLSVRRAGALFACGLVCWLSLGAGSASAQALAFVLTNSSDTAADFNTYFITDYSNIDGVALQESWNRYETSNGVYNWAALDSVLSRAAAANKKVSLHMAGQGSNAPAWLAQLSPAPQTYTGVDPQGHTQTYYVPWDPTYLGAYRTFIQALGSHISNYGYSNTLFDVSLVVPELEMNIPNCEGTLGSTTIPYNRTSYFNAWNVTVGPAIQTAFPTANKFVSAPAAQTICGMLPQDQDHAFYKDLLTDLIGLSPTFWMFAADLNVPTANVPSGSGRTQAYLSDFPTLSNIGYQMLGATTGTPSLSGTAPYNLGEAVCAGLSATGGRGVYFEVYKSDVLQMGTSAPIKNAIQAIHTPGNCPLP